MTFFKPDTRGTLLFFYVILGKIVSFNLQENNIYLINTFFIFEKLTNRHNF